MERRPTSSSMAVGAVVAAALILAGCAAEAAVGIEEPPISIEENADTGLARLTLSDAAADRLDIQTSVVESAEGKLVVPSAAVIIDTEGRYWVYTSPQPLQFVRSEIAPVEERGQQAFFEVGPAEGTAVVTTGVPELYGAEFGIGK